MKATDRSILVGVALLGLIAVFWFLVLSPKRERAAELEDKLTALETSVEQYEALAIAAEEAEESFDRNYKSLVVLGKAVPADSDTSSLFVQLNELAGAADVTLGSIELTAGPEGPPPPPAAETTADDAEAAGEAEAPPADSTTVADAAPTEAVASTLPLGATVGPAGLPVMPYTLFLQGSFFGLADFLKGVDDLVGFADAKPDVNGRLLTIDGFSIAPPQAEEGRVPGDVLEAEIGVTSYVSPEGEGVTAGATPASPAPPTATAVSNAPPPATVTP